MSLKGRPASLYLFSQDILILTLNHDFPISCGGVPILEDAGIFSFRRFCFVFAGIPPESSPHLAQAPPVRVLCCSYKWPTVRHELVLAISMSLYKKFPGHLGDLESVVNRGSGTRLYFFFSIRFPDLPLFRFDQNLSRRQEKNSGFRAARSKFR